jgi:hypothetical protein
MWTKKFGLQQRHTKHPTTIFHPRREEEEK